MWSKLKSWYYNTQPVAEAHLMLLRHCDGQDVHVYVNDNDGELRVAQPSYPKPYVEVTDAQLRERYLHYVRSEMADDVWKNKFVPLNDQSYVSEQGDICVDANSSWYHAFMVDYGSPFSRNSVTYSLTNALHGTEYRERIQKMKNEKSASDSDAPMSRSAYTRTIRVEVRPK